MHTDKDAAGPLRLAGGGRDVCQTLALPGFGGHRTPRRRRLAFLEPLKRVEPWCLSPAGFLFRCFRCCHTMTATKMTTPTSQATNIVPTTLV